jgi:ribosome-associated protein
VELAPGVTAPASAVRFQFARSGGPGGQNVNKVNSKAELWIALSALRGMSSAAIDRLRKLAGSRLTQGDELHLTAESSRSQEANRSAVLLRARELIEKACVEPRRRRKTRPSRASKLKRLESKRRRSKVKILRRSGADE